jgi:hypothetical protein
LVETCVFINNRNRTIFGFEIEQIVWKFDLSEQGVWDELEVAGSNKLLLDDVFCSAGFNIKDGRL